MGVRRAPVWNSPGPGSGPGPHAPDPGRRRYDLRPKLKSWPFTGTWSRLNKKYSFTLTRRVRALLAFYGLQQPDASYIQKPFTPVALAETLRQVLSTVGGKH